MSMSSNSLLQSIKRRLDRQIPHDEEGFVKGKGAREHIINLGKLIENVREFNIPVV